MHYGTEAQCQAAELSVRRACTVRSAQRHRPCGPAEQTVRGLRTNRAARPNNLCGASEQTKLQKNAKRYRGMLCGQTFFSTFAPIKCL